MKKLTILLLFTFFIISATAQDSLNNAYKRINALEASVREVNDSITKLKINTAIEKYYDSSAVAKAKADPAGTIFKNAWVFKKAMPRGSGVAAMFSTAIVIIVLILFRLARNTNLLRDEGYGADGVILPVDKRPYSFSRVQLYWWTMIILVCFSLFFFTSWTLLPLNVTCIILLGLGATTHIGGRILDQKDASDDNVELGARKQDHKNVQGGVGGFFTDILNDGTGTSIHRFQAVIFNIVFGLGFIVFFAQGVAWHNYPLIDLSEWQLALLGVSSATYLSVKATENSKSSARKKPRNSSSNVDE